MVTLRCFKHGCAGRVLPSGRTEGGPLQHYRPDTHRCRAPIRHLWGQGKAAGLIHDGRLCCLSSARRLCILTWIKERECDPAVGLLCAAFLTKRRNSGGHDRVHVKGACPRARWQLVKFSRDVWTQYSDQLAELYRFRCALCAAVAPEHQFATVPATLRKAPNWRGFVHAFCLCKRPIGFDGSYPATAI